MLEPGSKDYLGGGELNVWRDLISMRDLKPCRNPVVRGNVVIIKADLEILDIVEFLAFLVTRGNRESISTECKIFYPVAFFLGAVKGIPYYDVINPSPRKGLQKFFFQI